MHFINPATADKQKEQEKEICWLKLISFTIKKITYNSKCLVTWKSEVITKMCVIICSSDWAAVRLALQTLSQCFVVTKMSKKLRKNVPGNINSLSTTHRPLLHNYIQCKMDPVSCFYLFEINEAPGFALGKTSIKCWNNQKEMAFWWLLLIILSSFSWCYDFIR